MFVATYLPKKEGKQPSGRSHKGNKMSKVCSFCIKESWWMEVVGQKQGLGQAEGAVEKDAKAEVQLR